MTFESLAVTPPRAALPKDLPEMNRRTKLKTYTLALCLLAAAVSSPSPATAQSNTPSKPGTAQVAAQPATPSEVVRAYYTALKESRVRDAMLMSVLRPAVESLSADELKGFELDFARLAATAPTDFEITGEQLSGEEATVFVRTGEGDETAAARRQRASV